MYALITVRQNMWSFEKYIKFQTFTTFFMTFYMLTVFMMLSYLHYEKQQSFWRIKDTLINWNKTKITDGRLLFKPKRPSPPLHPPNEVVNHKSAIKDHVAPTPFNKDFPDHPNPLVDGSSPNCSNDLNKIRVTQFHKLTDEMYFLSAYYDTRKPDEPYIRVLALLTEKASKLTIYCYVEDLYKDIFNVKAIPYVFNENHGRPFGGWILSCPVKNLVNKNMCQVHMSLHPELNLLDYPTLFVTLPLIATGQADKPFIPEYKFSVCIPPLFGDIKQSHLVEFIEMSKLLGASHFHFYPYQGDGISNQSNNDVEKVLNFYRKKGTISTYPWRLPIQKDQVWYYGQMLAIHHCMFTNMNSTQYIMFNDIDEFLIPTKWPTWTALMRKLDDDLHSGWRFRSAFFPPDNSGNLITLASRKRTANLNKIRTKCMVRPDRMFEMGIHHISKWNEEKWTPVDVGENMAVLHHYRECDSGFGMNCNGFVSDDTMLRYKDKLIENFNAATKDLNELTDVH